jgi:hypothetical protein
MREPAQLEQQEETVGKTPVEAEAIVTTAGK